MAKFYNLYSLETITQLGESRHCIQFKRASAERSSLAALPGMVTDLHCDNECAKCEKLVWGGEKEARTWSARMTFPCLTRIDSSRLGQRPQDYGYLRHVLQAHSLASLICFRCCLVLKLGLL